MNLLLLELCLVLHFLAARRWSCRFYAGDVGAHVCYFCFSLFLLPYLLGLGSLLQPHALLAGSVLYAVVSFYVCRANSAALPRLNLACPASRGGWIVVLVGVGAALGGAHELAHRYLIYHSRFVHPLNSDALAGSLPSLIDIVQSGSLWTMKSDYAHYILGYELFQSWAFVFLRSEALLGLVHYFFLFLLIFYSLRLLRLLFRQSQFRSPTWELFAYGVFALALLQFPPLKLWVYQPFAKTDLPSMAFAVMATYYALGHALSATNSPAQFQILAVSMALLSSVKPHAIYYIALVYLFLLQRHIRARKAWRGAIVSAWPLLLTAILYWRFSYGSKASLTTLGFTTTWVAAVFFPNHAMFQQLFGSLPGGELKRVLFYPSWGTIPFYGAMVLSAGLWLMRKRLSEAVRTANLFLFLSIVVFAVSPLVVWYPTLHIRYSLALMPLMLALLAFLGAQGLARLFPERAERVCDVSRARFALPAIFAVALLLLHHQASRYRPKAGFEGYPGDYAEPAPSDVYRWVWNNLESKKIYFVGPRAYGLYGKGFRNELFYNLQVKSDLGDAAERWLIGMEQFQPDYFVYKEYASCQGPRCGEPPAGIRELLKRKDRVRLVHHDANGAVFEVLKVSR